MLFYSYCFDYNVMLQTNAATVSHSTGPRKFPVEARAIRARMDTSRVRSVLDMGFSRDLVYKVIEQRLTTTGEGKCLIIFCSTYFPYAHVCTNARTHTHCVCIYN